MWGTVPYRASNQSWTKTAFFTTYGPACLLEADGGPEKYWLVHWAVGYPSIQLKLNFFSGGLLVWRI
jgi:hypothetical protein